MFHRLLRRVLAALLVLATALVADPLLASSYWLLPLAGILAAVVLAPLVAELARLPRALDPLASLAGLLVGCWLLLGTPGRTALLSRARSSLAEALEATRSFAPPLELTDPVLLLLCLIFGLIGVLATTLAPSHPASLGILLIPGLAIPYQLLGESAPSWKLLLLACAFLALLFHDHQRAEEAWAPRTGVSPSTTRALLAARITLPVLLAALLLPLLTPTSPLLDVQALLPGRTSTLTTYNPLTSLEGELNLPDPRPVLLYTTSDPTPEYLRLTTLDRFDEEVGWSSSPLQGQSLRDEPLSPPPGDDVTTRIRIRSLDTPWIPLPISAPTLDLPGWSLDPEAEVVFSTRSTTQDLDELTVSSTSPELSPARLRRADDRATSLPESIQPYARPDAPLSPEARDLARALTEASPSRFDAALALQEFFQDPSFRYTHQTSPEQLPGATPLVSFLAQREGFCEQYASAYAALARSAGLPVRVAIGFTPGTEVAPGRYEVTTSEAHAWPEVWFEGAGWVRFEPTPRAGVTDVPAYADPEPAPSASPTPSSAASPTPSASSSASPRRSPQPAAEPTAPPRAAPPLSPGRSPLQVIASILAILVALPLGLREIREIVRERAMPDPLRRAWDEILGLAARAGCALAPSDTPRRQRARLRAHLHAHPGDATLPSAWEPALERLSLALERARFAPPGAPLDLQPDDAVVLRRALLGTLSPPARAWARFLPPRPPAPPADRDLLGAPPRPPRSGPRPAPAPRRAAPPRPALPPRSLVRR